MKQPRFANLPLDIIYNFWELFAFHINSNNQAILPQISKLNGDWKDVYLYQCRQLGFRSVQMLDSADSWKAYDDAKRNENLSICKAWTWYKFPEVRYIFGLLNPQFSTIEIMYSEKEDLSHVIKDFLAKQLNSPWLKSVFLELGFQLGLEKEFVRFCLSDNFLQLHFGATHMEELSIKAFNQIFKNWQTRTLGLNRQARNLTAYLHASKRSKIAQKLKIPATSDGNFEARVNHKFEKKCFQKISSSVFQLEIRFLVKGAQKNLF
ncbi:hypothetical protein L596_021917 [Steinernema carpocapsae]|uniref:Uncharacterized protein n=1 Tax=Steinernema carpocapsae TaxID=34508 RepID=A0A4U5MKJ1_STECR|nr:hypothetical protein L596_021917 [Steinernema carpocapsae]